MLARPSKPGKIAFSAACGFLMGVVPFLLRRTTGFWKRVLPSALPMLVFQIGSIFYFGGDAANNHLLEFLIGSTFGVFLMLSAYQRRRKA